MLNIGAGEITLILVVALLVLGPSRLPELARGLGKFLREFRSRTDEVRHVVEREFYRMDSEVQALPPPQLGPREGAPGHGVASNARVAPSPVAAPAPLDALAEGTLLPPPETVAISAGPMPAPVASDPHAGPLDPSVARTVSQPSMTPEEAERLLAEAAAAKGDPKP